MHINFENINVSLENKIRVILVTNLMLFPVTAANHIRTVESFTKHRINKPSSYKLVSAHSFLINFIESGKLCSMGYSFSVWMASLIIFSVSLFSITECSFINVTLNKLITYQSYASSILQIAITSNGEVPSIDNLLEALNIYAEFYWN